MLPTRLDRTGFCRGNDGRGGHYRSPPGEVQALRSPPELWPGDEVGRWLFWRELPSVPCRRSSLVPCSRPSHV
jgi:hypothetical protein